jgi:gliding motility-associated-like protein
MLMRNIVCLFLMLLCTNRLMAQACSNLGQTPATAFPVCGTTAFSQSNVPICGSHTINVPGCTGPGYGDKNPFWYRFTCFTAGTLSFVITPNNLGDDYDWMLYDITGRNPNEVFTNNSLIVTGNWAGTPGLTGASATGVTFIQCGSGQTENKPTFAKSPNLVVGHEYLLLVSHFDDTQSGYKLSFGGGTAVITDPQLPKLVKSEPGPCAATTVGIKLNKRMKCSSLRPDGSDFSLSPAVATITAAAAPLCSNSFDMDSVVLTMSNPLPPGVYTITMKAGGDGNTLLDNCDRDIPAGDNVTFSVLPIVPTPMDSLTKPGCAPQVLELVFSKPVVCNSVAANGSDFIVTGTTPVTVTGATGTCTNGLTRVVRVQLSAPIQTAGVYNIQLVRGNDGNSLLDACNLETPPGARLPFITSDTVNAGFSYQVQWGCIKDTVAFSHPGNNGINQWKWNFNNEGNSTQQNPTFIFPTFGNKKVSLWVTNGVCKDSTETVVALDNELNAAFGYPDVLCPQDMAVFTDSSIGQIVSWRWDLGDNTTSTLQEPPPHKYPQLTNARTKLYPVQLIIQNNHNCFDTVVHQVKVVNTCIIAIPNAFTPNGDGINDYLYPLNAYKASNLEFRVYNRYGQVVFQTKDWTRKWDGTINGQAQATGTYVWTLSYTNNDTRAKVFTRGTSVLIR